MIVKLTHVHSKPMRKQRLDTLPAQDSFVLRLAGWCGHHSTVFLPVEKNLYPFGGGNCPQNEWIQSCWYKCSEVLTYFLEMHKPPT